MRTDPIIAISGDGDILNKTSALIAGEDETAFLRPAP